MRHSKNAPKAVSISDVLRVASSSDQEAAWENVPPLDVARLADFDAA